MSGAVAAKQPNIIVILTDDMGYSDLGCYGGVIETPNLNSLAENGLRYTQFYNTARSCPSRASLLTGLHPHQAGVGRMVTDLGEVGYQGQLNPNCVTMGEVLKGAGYETYAIGKWHVANVDIKDGAESVDKRNWPTQRGFDHYYGPLTSGNYFDPPLLVRDNEFISPFNDPQYRAEGTYYTTNAFGDNAVKYIDERDKSKPFFLYCAFVAAHWPLQALDEDIAKYKGRFDGGWEEIRKEVFANMKREGLISNDAELTHDATIKNWDKVENQAFEARCMEVYAAMVSTMDRNVGKIVDKLRKDGELDNTLIFYLQDNGGCPEMAGKQYPKSQPIPTAGRTIEPRSDDYILLDKRACQTRDGRPIMEGYGTMPGGCDTHIGYGRVWANVSNTPFREYKHYIHEGGISTPLIACWGDKIKSHGELRTQSGQLMDIMATCIDVSGAKYPETRDGEKVHPYEGHSLVPSFKRAKPVEPNRELFWEHQGNRGVRVGDWKAVAKQKRGASFDMALSNWELYDISTDRGEQHDLASQHPDILKELVAKWDAYAERCFVKPFPKK